VRPDAARSSFMTGTDGLWASVMGPAHVGLRGDHCSLSDQRHQSFDVKAVSLAQEFL
jgi:hypothetical protein